LLLVMVALCVKSAVAADVAAGRKKAATYAVCHGEFGMSALANAPHLAGQPAVYSAEQLRQFKTGKRPSEVMTVIAKLLSDQDIDDLAAWYESIRIEAKPPP
jgi:cytochrome c553